MRWENNLVAKAAIFQNVKPIYSNFYSVLYYRMAHPYLTPKELEEELVYLCGCNQVLIPQKDEGPAHEKATVFYNFNYFQTYHVQLINYSSIFPVLTTR